MTEIKTDVVIIGAGAAGLMCAIEAGKRGRKVMLIDHASKVGETIRISGGGRCNFTNINAAPEKYISDNPHFCRSALARFTPADFIQLVEEHRIHYYEKTLGQLFCTESAKLIVNMLVNECNEAGVDLRLNTEVARITKTDDGFRVSSSTDRIVCASVVIASGGKSIPARGATGFGYDIADQFGLKIIEIRLGLVPLTFQADRQEDVSNLAGVYLTTIASVVTVSFR